MNWIVLSIAFLVLTASGPSSAGEDTAIASAVRFIHRETADHRLILLGEMHGTREIPLLVGQLVSTYAAEGSVVLGLEVDASEQAALRQYLASDGGPSARKALRTRPFWHVKGTQHDGRRNENALDLIEHLRLLRFHGRPVDIVPFDNLPDETMDSEGRDAAMAARIREAFADLPRGRLLALSGNVHAMLARPEDAPPEMQRPMGSYLRDLDVYSVDITANAGAYWACTAQCGPMQVPAFNRMSGRSSDGVNDLQVVLPRFTVARLIGASSAR
jgi:erythromycin esterase-like protein